MKCNVFYLAVFLFLIARVLVFFVFHGIGEREVELPFLHVGPCHLYAYWVAKLILVMMPSPSQQEVFSSNS